MEQPGCTTEVNGKECCCKADEPYPIQESLCFCRRQSAPDRLTSFHMVIDLRSPESP